MRIYGDAANAILQALKGEGPEPGRVEFEGGQDINRPIETERPLQKATFCNFNPGVICCGGKCTVRCNRHPWHIEFKRGHIRDKSGIYARSSPIKPGPPK
jgi:hypothetical protein